jgi:heterodisulfide reductase subunit C
MQKILIEKAKQLICEGVVTRVLGWKKGEFCYDITPFMYTNVEELERDFVFDDFCAANLSKYLIPYARKEGKTLVFLKPCDSYSFTQLLNEHRISRESVYAVAIPCYGKADVDKIKDKGIQGILGIKPTEDRKGYVVNTLYGEETVERDEVLLEKCISCKSKMHPTYDELLFEEGELVADCTRFDEVEKIEAMTPDERFEFFRNELSRCIRCNACRNVCPACSCEKCVFDNVDSGVENKAAANDFEDKLFHIIRAFHVAGRCTDCGECTRVCPQHIPLHLINRKLIKDMSELYGDYMAGAGEGSRTPLTSYKTDDHEPSIVYKRGGDKK